MKHVATIIATNDLEGRVRWCQPERVELGVKLYAMSEPVPFDEAWKQKEAEGFNYGEDALELVRMGYEMAMEQKR